MNLMTSAVALVERGRVPEALVRAGIRRIVRGRLQSEATRHADRETTLAAWLGRMAASPIAMASQAANTQHYEVPPAFYGLCLGANQKYSSGYWPAPVTGLDQAEEAMLELTAQRAGLANGQHILDLGCGWGSLTIWAARRFPGAHITGVSGSAPQRARILARAAALGLTNVDVITADMNVFAAPRRFDRVVSIEMFEHMRNWGQLLHRVRDWLEVDGKAFVHVFSHKSFAYPFEDAGDADWMARHFFTGGMMPSHDLLPRLDADLTTTQQWWLDGTHYGRTSNAWHARLQQHRHRAVEVLGGGREGRVRYERWRLFFLACAELFGYAGGSEWGVSHYLLEPRK